MAAQGFGNIGYGLLSPEVLAGMAYKAPTGTYGQALSAPAPALSPGDSFDPYYNLRNIPGLLNNPNFSWLSGFNTAPMANIKMPEPLDPTKYKSAGIPPEAQSPIDQAADVVTEAATPAVDNSVDTINRLLGTDITSPNDLISNITTTDANGDGKVTGMDLYQNTVNEAEKNTDTIEGVKDTLVDAGAVLAGGGAGVLAGGGLAGIGGATAIPGASIAYILHNAGQEGLLPSDKEWKDIYGAGDQAVRELGETLSAGLIGGGDSPGRQYLESLPPAQQDALMEGTPSITPVGWVKSVEPTQETTAYEDPLQTMLNSRVVWDGEQWVPVNGTTSPTPAPAPEPQVYQPTQQELIQAAAVQQTVPQLADMPIPQIAEMLATGPQVPSGLLSQPEPTAAPAPEPQAGPQIGQMSDDGQYIWTGAGWNYIWDMYGGGA